MDQKLVAVVIPFSKPLTESDSISFNHLKRYLSSYDKYSINPESFKNRLEGCDIKHFDNTFFGSTTAHRNLLLSKQFYTCFSDYKYILMYHLDALVLSDQLLQWCEYDIDYIGSPWVRCPGTPWVHRQRVGNGGFSLRKIETFLQVIEKAKQGISVWPRIIKGGTNPGEYVSGNEDLFWSDRAIYYHPEFKVAPFELGLKFGFEANPRGCFSMNNNKLPFGCHAWEKYDRSFWEPHIV